MEQLFSGMRFFYHGPRNTVFFRHLVADIKNKGGKLLGRLPKDSTENDLIELMAPADEWPADRLGPIYRTDFITACVRECSIVDRTMYEVQNPILLVPMQQASPAPPPPAAPKRKPRLDFQQQQPETQLPDEPMEEEEEEEDDIVDITEQQQQTQSRSQSTKRKHGVDLGESRAASAVPAHEEEEEEGEEEEEEEKQPSKKQKTAARPEEEHEGGRDSRGVAAIKYVQEKTGCVSHVAAYFLFLTSGDPTRAVNAVKQGKNYTEDGSPVAGLWDPTKDCYIYTGSTDADKAKLKKLVRFRGKESVTARGTFLAL